MRPKIALIMSITVLMMAILACQFPGQEETPTTAPTATMTATETVMPTSTVEPPPDLPIFTNPIVFSLAMFTPSEGWALTRGNSSLLVTVNGGTTWFEATPPALLASTPDPTLRNFSPFFLDENAAWFTPFTSGTLYHTQDKGVTWSTTSLPFDSARYFFLDLDNGFALVDLGAGAGSQYVALYRTDDGGVSWTEVFSHEPGVSKSLPEGGTKNGITFLDMNHGWIGGTYPMTDYFYLHYTTDGGATWSREMDISLPGTFAGTFLDVFQPFFISATVGYLPVRVIPSSGDMQLLVYRSDDSGQTWTFQNAVLNGRDVDFSSVDEGWLAGGTALHHTIDGGATWTPVTTSGIPTGYYLLDVDFVDSLHGWVVTTPDDSTWEPLILYTTSDGGSNWMQLLP